MGAAAYTVEDVAGVVAGAVEEHTDAQAQTEFFGVLFLLLLLLVLETFLVAGSIGLRNMIVAAVFSLLIGQFFGGHVVEIFMTSLTPPHGARFYWVRLRLPCEYFRF
ncbi:hypothetical protein AQS70_07730 [Pseudomonas endophytica]|uniref:Uncharacterized protein n=1 Tax=Pseudomonas endophytica TaxID=1563157 RepID=A0A0Q0XUX0_9PSED|nr:hypothetical protein [Pseudomonas endophytica]KQB54338.1 hypothetical protein AQS70_07730 [Pseudomonas endophytica]